MENTQTAELAKKFELKPEVVKQYRKTFDSYDKQQEGTVLVKDLPAIFKILGTTITDNESTPLPTQSTKSWAIE